MAWCEWRSGLLTQGCGQADLARNTVLRVRALGHVHDERLVTEQSCVFGGVEHDLLSMNEHCPVSSVRNSQGQRSVFAKVWNTQTRWVEFQDGLIKVRCAARMRAVEPDY